MNIGFLRLYRGKGKRSYYSAIRVDGFLGFRGFRGWGSEDKGCMVLDFY